MKKQEDLKITLIIKYLKNGCGNLSLVCNKLDFRKTTIAEQLYFEAINHVCDVISHMKLNDEYFDLEKFINNNDKITIKYLLDESK